MRASVIPTAGMYRIVACIPTLHHVDSENVSLFRLTSCWSSLTSKAECTSCKFSCRTQWTGIFSALFFHACSNSHTWSMLYPPLPFHVLFLLSFSLYVSLRIECKSKFGSSIMTKLWRAQRYPQRGYYSSSGSWSNGGIMHSVKFSAAPPLCCTYWRLVKRWQC